MAVKDREVLTTVTEFTKTPGRWLNTAATGPVSITRSKKPSITLVNRDTWQNATISRAWLTIFSAVVSYTVDRVTGAQNASCPADFRWLELFDADDVREFVDELSSALNNVAQGLGTWDDVDTVVEEWRRSAAVLNDAELRRRFKQTLEDVRGDGN